MTDRPRGVVTSCSTSSTVTASTLSPSRVWSSERLASAGAVRSVSARSSSLSAATIRPNRNSSSSTASSRFSRSACTSSAVRPSSSSPSTSSRGVDHRSPTAATSTWSAWSETLPESSRVSRSARREGSADESPRVRRRPGSWSSSRTTENSSAPSSRAEGPAAALPRPAGLAAPPTTSSSFCSDAASASRLAAWNCVIYWVLCSQGALVPRRDGVEVVEEPVHGAPATRLVLEGLADDPARQLDRGATEVGPQLRDDLGTLGLQLRAPLSHDTCGFLLGLGAQLRLDPLRLQPGVVADARGLGTGLGQLRLVGLQRLLGLGLCLLGLLDAALDLLAALLVERLEPGERVLLQYPQQQEERDEPEDDLRRVRNDRVRRVFCRQHDRGVHHDVSRSYGCGLLRRRR